ncbi:energy-coupling factor ABC transporter ATP-binding protein [Allofustis seminis]|uniref:energy-coupling factor ABC transporter ATP-binding protein n=1 Tax=Allofustis seminis TaxID=166939 RepID=UPI00036CA88F|nr:energy-coupling factor ABC transporter ATP-binding protein [Allofustis seminis]
MITLQDVSFSYSGSKQRALNNIQLQIHSGEWVSIVGPNGSGKSTLARLINGLLEADEGTIQVAGTTLNEENVWAIRDRIGMVFQNPDNQFVGATVEDDVAFGLENRGVPRDEMKGRVHKALLRVGMWEFKDREPARLSGGQKQRVAIAGIIAVAPQIIILDEATSMLDPRGRKEILEIVHHIKKEQNLTVISITHDIEETLFSDRIIVMDAGQVQHVGTPEEIYTLGEDTLLRHELSLPFVEQLKRELKARHVPIPESYKNEERMAEWLWEYVLKK